MLGLQWGKVGNDPHRLAAPLFTNPPPAVAGFKGQAENTIDGKGRMPVPAKMRRALSPDAKETFVATRGLDLCVFLYPLDAWEVIEDEMGRLNQFEPEARRFVRTINMWAEELSLDGQGRIALPKSLLEFAGLQPGQKASVVGAYDRIEIWNPDTLEAHLNGHDESYESLAARVMGGG